MFIVIVSRGYPSSNSPLRGIFEFDQAKSLLGFGHKVVFVSLDMRSIRRKRKLGKSHFIREGIEVFNFSFPLGNVPGWLFVFVGKIILKLIYKDVMTIHGHPDIIHSHFTDISAISTILKKRFHLPLVITEHSSHLDNEILNHKTLFYAQRAYYKADRIIAVSTSLKNRIHQHFNTDCTVIPNIVDVQSFKLNRIPHPNFSLISVGNLNYKKGFDILIQAIAETKCKSIHVLIIGNGPLAKDLQKLVNALNLQGQIRLLGKKSREEINELMAISDAFVLASRIETFGVVLIEAMLAGLPVITTRCGGPEDFVNNNNGILVPVHNIHDLANAILEMKENLTRYNASDISEMCRNRFSPSAVAQQISTLYYSLNTKS
jgi:glycosyltransferase involved in cell wall biosynthesis